MTYTPPRRVTSTATTISVNAAALSWLPARGSWGSVSLNSTTSVSTAVGGYFLAGRDTATDSLTQYSGAIWNPYYGTYGAWMWMGGGHGDARGNVDNSVWAWSADTQRWVEVTPATYPGSIGTAYWPPAMTSSTTPNGDINSHYPEPFLTYCELSSGIPAANHSRRTLAILPPSVGGGTQGSFVVACMGASHVGGNTGSNSAHALNIATKTWSRVGPINSTANANGENRRSGCVDSQRGRIIHAGSTGWYWIDAQNPASWSARFRPTGYGAPFWDQSIVYCHEIDCFVQLGTTFELLVKSATDFYAGTSGTATAAPVTGSPPNVQPNEGVGGTWCKDLGSNGAIVCLDYTNNVVKACYAPASPTTGTWTWGTLTASNAPTFDWTGYDGANAGETYNKFQYAPALKSFFIGIRNAMWCFRPSEIPL